MNWLTKLCDCFLSVVAKLNLGSKVGIIFYCSKKTLFFQNFRKTSLGGKMFVPITITIRKQIISISLK